MLLSKACFFVEKGVDTETRLGRNLATRIRAYSMITRQGFE
jgi:hypothetical protein